MHVQGRLKYGARQYDYNDAERRGIVREECKWWMFQYNITVFLLNLK
jgi:hypothetical protein